MALSNEFITSKAKSEDAGEIRQLIQTESLHPFGLDWHNFLVVKKGYKIVACGQLRSHGKTSELSSLVVIPRYRRERIGLYLAQRLIEQSHTPIFLSGKVELESFYLLLGFEKVCWFDLPSEIKLESSLYLIAATMREKSLLFMKYKKEAENIEKLFVNEANIY